MGAFEWIAIIGAAAWVPQVVGWVTRHFVKPKVRVIPSLTPEIGYTTFGPIFNLTCAISAERKDAVIERMTAIVTHERGHSAAFQWTTLNETVSQLKTTEGIAEVSKNQLAIALKVSTLVLSEKQIAMQERTFEEDTRIHMNAVMDLYNHLKKTEPNDYQERTLKSKEFADLIDFSKKRFTWQDGNYTVELQLRIAGVKDATIQRFEFALSKNDVERLHQNLDEVEKYAQDVILPPDPPRQYIWNWAYPRFTEAKLPANVAR